MAELVRPFAALRPTATSAAEVVAPPYDVVSTEEARGLAAGRPRSFLHISRPEIDLPAGSSPYSDEAYAQGARSLERLVAERVLVRDDKPSVYIYRMVMDGRTQTGVAAERRRPRGRTLAWGDLAGDAHGHQLQRPSGAARLPTASAPQETHGSRESR